MGDWSYERVVMVTSDHDEVGNDQRRLLERKCKHIQKMHNCMRREMPVQETVTSITGEQQRAMKTDSKVHVYSSLLKIS